MLPSLLALVTTLVPTSKASSGPWVLGTGDQSLYLGGEAQRLTRLSVDDGQGNTQVIDVDQGLSTMGAKAILSVGLTPGLEVEGSLPWQRVYANRTDGPVCTTLGLGACQTTEGIGILSARVKGLLLDELRGGPVTVSLAGEVRHGGFTHDTRERITNLGEGTVDLGPSVAVGHIGSLGQGYWSGYAEVGWRARLPNTTTYPGLDAAPGNEWTGSTEWLVAPMSRVAFGPEFQGLYREGLDWGELDLSDPDRLGALSILTVRAGAKVIVRDLKNTSVVLGVLRTVAAKNNPTDTLVVSAGVGINGIFSRKD